MTTRYLLSETETAVPGGIPTLDNTGKIPIGQLPDAVVIEAEQTAAIAAGIVTAKQIPSNVQAASYTLVAADAGKVVGVNTAGAGTLTVPPNSAVPFPVGTVIEVVQAGAGQTTIAPGAGVGMASPQSAFALRAQWSRARLIKTGTDNWWLNGDLSSWRDNPPRAHLYQSVAQTALPTGWVQIILDSEAVDTANGHAAGAAGYTVPAGQAGRYQVSGHVSYGSFSSNLTTVAGIRVNGAMTTWGNGPLIQQGSNAATANYTGEKLLTLAAGDVVTLWGRVDGSGWATVVSGEWASQMALARID